MGNILNKVNQHKADKAAQSDALKQSVNQAYDSGQTGTSPMPGASQPQQPTAPVQQTEQAPAMPTDVKPEQPQLIKAPSDFDTAKARQQTVLNPMISVNTNPQVSQIESPLSRLSETDFKTRQANGTMNFSDKQYWQEQVKKNPDSTYAALKEYFASDETPEQKKKRERREQLGEVFRGLGNLIGNAANLYYTNKGGKYIDLNSVQEKHRERMQRLKDKQDALKQKQEEILINAKIGDMKAKRAERAADKEAQRKADALAAQRKADADKAKAQYLFDLGLIDARTKADLVKQAGKLKGDKELESIKHINRVNLKRTPSYGQDKVVTSLQGSDGEIYTRTSNLSDEEIRSLAKYVEDWTPYTHIDEDGKETIDYIGALADAAESGMVPSDVLEGMGYKRGKKSTGKSLPGVQSGNKKGKRLNL